MNDNGLSAFPSLAELVEDSKTCRRLTLYERAFLQDMERRAPPASTMLVSPAQLRVLRQIEAKVYAT